jgi:CRISPR-associated protein Cmr4
MYQKAHGVIETLAPLHVGATAGEESGNLNLIFRDQFTQTGIVPGSSIRGRLRAEMRQRRQDWLEKALTNAGEAISKAADLIAEDDKDTLTKLQWLEKKAIEHGISVPVEDDEHLWYGHEAVKGEPNSTTEALVKFEYASVLWLPVFCPGQPIVWVSSRRLLKRYNRMTGGTISAKLPEPYTSSRSKALDRQKLFFNFGFVTMEHPPEDLSKWFPDGHERPAVVVGDDEIAMIHDMALYRQTRVALSTEEKVVENFFNTEALPEETILVFPIAHRPDQDGNLWKPAQSSTPIDIYLGGLESIGFGHCELTLKGV